MPDNCLDHYLGALLFGNWLWSTTKWVKFDIRTYLYMELLLAGITWRLTVTLILVKLPTTLRVENGVCNITNQLKIIHYMRLLMRQQKKCLYIFRFLIKYFINTIKSVGGYAIKILSSVLSMILILLVIC